MTNQLIFEIIIAIGASFLSALWDRISPDAKKTTSYIKKFLRFIFVYTLPIASIIFFMIAWPKVDKFFVFVIALNLFVLSLHFTVFIYDNSIKKLIERGGVLENLSDLHKSHDRRLTEVESKIGKGKFKK